MDTSERSARRPLDAVALQRVRRRLAAADTAPWLHDEVSRRMVERLSIVKRTPQQLIDWSGRVGTSTERLRAAYPGARLQVIEHGAARQAAPKPAWWSPQRWSRGAKPEQVDERALQPGQAELVWSNMTLHGEIDPQACMQQWQRALAVDGFLMFSTLGPGTLVELRKLYESSAWPAPFAPFVDMHDLGDMLLHAGFADPVMDQESLTLTWPTAQALLHELRGLGGNVAPDRAAGLRTPRWRADLERRLLARADATGRIAMTFEIVYGHAFKAAPRVPVAAETTVGLDDMRAMVRQRRP